MRKGFTVALIATLLFGGGYFYYIAQAVCPTPIAYSLGEIDARFNLTKDEVRLAVSNAESVWEDATGRNLFSYEEDGALVIHFVYDERQELINEEDLLKEKLDETQDKSKEINNTYADLVVEYDKLKANYTQNAEAYESKLRAYNAEVAKYNNQGGAPKEVYASLEAQKKELDAEQKSLNALSASLNTLVKQINAIGEKGNLLINTYNKGVNVYNEAFGEPREFTQGDYSNSTIKIYTFEDERELELVLVHELGHALSLDHVEGPDSVMYYLIGDQPMEVALSANDLGEFNRVCGALSIWEKLKILLEWRLHSSR